MMVAMPMPPPMQSVISAVALPVRSSSSRAVPIRQAPVAPSGWPSAIAPPLTLMRAGSMPSLRAVWSGTVAKASLISQRSMSETAIPAFFSALAEAGAGAVSMITGSAPAVAVARTRARTLRPCALA